MHIFVYENKGVGVAAHGGSNKRTFLKKRWFFENTTFEIDHPLAGIIKKKTHQISNIRNEKGATLKYAMDIKKKSKILIMF